MEENLIYKTPISCLRRLIENDKSDEFKIIFKLIKNDQASSLNSKNSKTERIIINTTINQARTISKKINDIYLIDPTFDQYEFHFPINDNVSQEYFNAIEKMTKKILSSICNEITITENEREIFYKILVILGEQNDETKKGMDKIINSIDEAISLLSTEFHDNSIIYLSSHIEEFLTKSVIDHIDTDIVNEIIDAYIENLELDKTKLGEIFEILKNKEEETTIVMHFLMSLEKRGCEEMNESMLEYFYDNLDDEIISKEMSGIISIIRKHYKSIERKPTNKTKKEKSVERICEFDGNELKGINFYLQQQYGDDVGNNGILKISGGGKPHPSYPLTNLIKYNSNKIDNYYFNYSDYGTRTESEGWIEFDFCNRKINLTSYTIRSNLNSSNSSFHPKSWRIVGSNDQDKWEVIDHRTNNSDLNGPHKQHRFECTNNNNYYRYIRYIQEDICSNDSHKYYVYLTCIEFFGSIYSHINLI